MRRLTGLFSLALAAVAVVFAVSNRTVVVVAFWPFLDGLAMPLFLVVLLALLFGFLTGCLYQRLKRRPRGKFPSPPIETGR